MGERNGKNEEERLRKTTGRMSREGRRWGWKSGRRRSWRRGRRMRGEEGVGGEEEGAGKV